jgi:hypothetical protein
MSGCIKGITLYSALMTASYTVAACYFYCLLSPGFELQVLVIKGGSFRYNNKEDSLEANTQKTKNYVSYRLNSNTKLTNGSLKN